MKDEMKVLLREVIKDELTGVRTDLAEFRKEVNNRLSNLEDGQEFLKKGQESIERKISSIPFEYEGLENSIGNSFKNLEAIQDRQQSLIETLSVRSIQHENDIREIKKTIKK